MSFFNANKRVENSSTLEMAIKRYTEITWFSVSVQAGIFVAEHERWVKRECKFVKKLTYYLYHKTLEHDLKS